MLPRFAGPIGAVATAPRLMICPLFMFCVPFFLLPGWQAPGHLLFSNFLSINTKVRCLIYG